MGILGDFKRERLTAAEMTQIRSLPLFGSGPITATNGPGGTALAFNTPPHRITDIRVAKIVDAGPRGADLDPDSDDERYWLSIQAAETAGSDPDPDDPGADPAGDPLTLYDAANEYPDDQIVPATNLSDWAEAGGSHTLAVDGTVVVLAFLWHDDNGTERWVFQGPSGDRAVHVSIGTPVSGENETYNGQVIDPVDNTTVLYACYIVNLDGKYTSGGGVHHWLDYTTAGHEVGFLTSFTATYTGTTLPVVYIPSGPARLPSNPLVERLATTEIWYRDAAVTGAGTRGDEPIIVKLRSETSGKFRDIQIAADGRIHSISAEF